MNRIELLSRAKHELLPRVRYSLESPDPEAWLDSLSDAELSLWITCIEQELGLSG
jgi:hypothetical protein